MAVIGIDLGTTNSCVAVVEGTQPEVIVNAEGERTTPSAVAFSKEGERLIGTIALRQAAMNPDRTITSVKRHMGTDWRADIDGKAYSPQEISSMILRKLRTDAETFLNQGVTDAVITVPAYFNDMQRQATKDAGRIAGLNVLRIINEPTAAALAYGLDHGDPQMVMVYDLGGGTFDVSIIEIGDNVIEVLSTAGNNHLGGDDFDARLANHLADAFKAKTGVDLERDQMAMQRIREAAQQAKRSLLHRVDRREPPLPRARAPRPAASRRDHHALDVRPHHARSGRSDGRPGNPGARRCGHCGERAGKRASRRRINAHPRRAKLRAEPDGQAPVVLGQPDECVAQGAAVQGATLSNAAQGLMPRGGELCCSTWFPMSFAIETIGGVATRVIERNTTLPIHYEQVFTTAAAFQTKVEVHVLQGERPMARDNKTIGKFQLKGH